MKIFLIGLPGSGKTTIGRELAKNLSLSFLDLDAEIEAFEEETIDYIFSSKEESYFRKTEAFVLKKWCNDKTDFVMATGGGTPCFFNNMTIMKNVGKTIFLNVDCNTIYERLRNDNSRPILKKLKDKALFEKIENLFKERLSFTINHIFKLKIHPSMKYQNFYEG